MINIFKNNLVLLFFSVISLFSGLDIIINGEMRNLQLGDERYLIGGVITIIGLYALYLIYKNKNKAD